MSSGDGDASTHSSPSPAVVEDAGSNGTTMAIAVPPTPPPRLRKPSSVSFPVLSRSANPDTQRLLRKLKEEAEPVSVSRPVRNRVVDAQTSSLLKKLSWMEREGIHQPEEAYESLKSVRCKHCGRKCLKSEAVEASSCPHCGFRPIPNSERSPDTFESGIEAALDVADLVLSDAANLVRSTTRTAKPVFQEKAKSMTKLIDRPLKRNEKKFVLDAELWLDDESSSASGGGGWTLSSSSDSSASSEESEEWVDPSWVPDPVLDAQRERRRLLAKQQRARAHEKKKTNTKHAMVITRRTNNNNNNNINTGTRSGVRRRANSRGYFTSEDRRQYDDEDEFARAKLSSSAGDANTTALIRLREMLRGSEDGNDACDGEEEEEGRNEHSTYMCVADDAMASSSSSSSFACALDGTASTSSTASSCSSSPYSSSSLASCGAGRPTTRSPPSASQPVVVPSLPDFVRSTSSESSGIRRAPYGDARGGLGGPGAGHSLSDRRDDSRGRNRTSLASYPPLSSFSTSAHSDRGTPSRTRVGGKVPPLGGRKKSITPNHLHKKRKGRRKPHHHRGDSALPPIPLQHDREGSGGISSSSSSSASNGVAESGVSGPVLRRTSSCSEESQRLRALLEEERRRMLEAHGGGCDGAEEAVVVKDLMEPSMNAQQRQSANNHNLQREEAEEDTNHTKRGGEEEVDAILKDGMGESDPSSSAVQWNIKVDGTRQRRAKFLGYGREESATSEMKKSDE